MRSIQDTTEQFSSYSSEHEDSDSSGSDAWSEEVSSFKTQAIRKIIAANRKVHLYGVLKNYGIHLPKSYTTQTWSNLIRCPFPSHKDKTPSFGYNFRTGHFNCLGCKLSGKAVEFIAAKEGKPKTLIAESILEHYADSEYIDDDFEDEVEDPRVQGLLFEMSETFRECLQKYKNNSEKTKHIEKVVWWFDMYIAIRAGSRNSCRTINIDVEELQTRVSRAQALLSELMDEA